MPLDMTQLLFVGIGVVVVLVLGEVLLKTAEKQNRQEKKEEI